MSAEEKKPRGKPPKPGIPFRKQTAKQRSFLALIRALDSFGYQESKYTAAKFININTLKHMNMRLLATVLYFMQRYDIVDKYNILETTGKVRPGNLDITQLKDLTPQNIQSINSDVFESKQNISEEVQYKHNVDFLRYFIFALQVLRSKEIQPDNSKEINELLLSLEPNPK
jgi:hypothetical protein